MIKTATFAAAAAIAALAAPAVAATAATADDSRPRAAVTYADLDLTSEEGMARLERRINRAAREVCGVGDVATGTRLRSDEARACYVETRRQLQVHFAQIRRDAALGG